MDEDEDQREIMNAAEAAAFLRVTAETVRHEARAGRLPGRRVGKEWRFARSVLLDWLHATEGAGDQRYARKDPPPGPNDPEAPNTGQERSHSG